jgi:hypothetical protein
MGHIREELAFIFMIIAWAATGNEHLGAYAFWSSVFLAILAMLTDELKKREALVTQQSYEKRAVTSPSYSPVPTWYALGTHWVSTKTVVDLNVGGFAPHLAIRTDTERSRCVLSQYLATYTPANRIIQD